MQPLENNLLRRNAAALAAYLAAGILAATLFVGCSKKAADDESAAKPEMTATQVTVTQVTVGSVSRLLQLTGSVAAVPNRDVKLSALVAGRIEYLDVAEGDKVTAGQLIAKIDDHSYRDQVAQAQAGVSHEQADVENAKLNLARNEDLVQRGISARKDLEDARTESNVNEAALKQAQAMLSTAQLQFSRTELRSPISGTVVKRFVSGGEQVDGTGAAPIVEIAALSEVELNANVPAADLNRMPVGEAIQLTSTALPGKNFTGHVIAVSPAVDPATNSGLVRIRIPNASGELRLGMFLGAQVPVETHPKALTVPAQAIYRDQDSNPRVFLVTGDTATSTAVTLGFETPDKVELLSGVKPGDTVILTGGYGLSDKAKISVQAAPNPTTAAPDKNDDKKDEK
jgi:membrane fusion protein, multidrug efflux system